MSFGTKLSQAGRVTTSPVLLVAAASKFTTNSDTDAYLKHIITDLSDFLYKISLSLYPARKNYW